MVDYVVTTLGDERFDGGTEAEEQADGGGLSLREALGLSVAAGGSHTVTFQSGLSGTIRIGDTDGDGTRDDPSLDTLVVQRRPNSFVETTVSVDGDNRVTVNGDRDGNDILLGDTFTDVTASLAAGLLSDNVQVFRAGNGGHLTLKGMTVTGGNASGDEDDGGALGVNMTGSARVEDSFLVGNYAAGTGGAIFATAASSLAVRDSQILFNMSGDSAGGIGKFGGGGLNTTNVVLSGNTVPDGTGGAFFIYAVDNPRLANTVIEGNAADRGGGIYTFGPKQVLNGAALTVKDNDAGRSGGGFYQWSDGTIKINGGLVTGNEAADGSHVFSGGSFLTENVAIFGNGPASLPAGAAAAPSAADEAIGGSATADFLRGKGGDDTVSGGGGPDKVFGGSGDDEVAGGTGNDVVAGGEGDDLVQGNRGSDLVSGGRGDDTAQGGGGQDLVLGGSGFDEVAGNAGDDLVRGGRGSDSVEGGAGDDNLHGGRDNDLVFGGRGDDQARGGEGHDMVVGGLGEDTINGGHDDDLLVGDAGGPQRFADTFKFANDFADDVILDYDIGLDRILMVGYEEEDLVEAGAIGDDFFLGFVNPETGLANSVLITGAAATFDPAAEILFI